MSLTSFPTIDLTESSVPDSLLSGIIAIGNFDGVHLGHQHVLSRARSESTSDTPCLALTFEPHPRDFFTPDSSVFRLTPPPMKSRVLAAFGLDGVLVLPFTKELSSTSASDFIDNFLLTRARASHIVTGYNFHFGKGREGSPEFLKEHSSRSGNYEVTVVDEFSLTNDNSGDDNSGSVSSSRVRDFLETGDIESASKILGYRWTVSGTVERGAERGRTLGYPTANIALPESCRLRHGIYATRLRRSSGEIYDSVSSFGRRPTFDNGAPLLETYIFDFSDDLYNEQVEVSLFSFIRAEKKFDTEKLLITQMRDDEHLARDFFVSASPLSPLDSRLCF